MQYKILTVTIKDGIMLIAYPKSASGVSCLWRHNTRHKTFWVQHDSMASDPKIEKWKKFLRFTVEHCVNTCSLESLSVTIVCSV